MTVVDMVWPDQSNHHGTLFGGAALSILDRLAFIGASRVLCGNVVTASVGNMQFMAPAPAGHLVECAVQLLRRGRRSATLRLELVAEDLLSGQRTDCLQGEFVMVRKPGAAPAPPAALAPVGEPSPWCRATVAEIVFPGHANHRGMLHGGPAMEWMAKAGLVAATRQVRRPVVLASSGQLDFAAPAYAGDLVEVSATVLAVGRRSVQVQVELWAESPATGERRCCTTGRWVFVALAEP